MADGSDEAAGGCTTGHTSGRMSGRIEVVGRISGRRRWSDQQKLSILEAAFGRGGTVRAATSVPICPLTNYHSVAPITCVAWAKAVP